MFGHVTRAASLRRVLVVGIFLALLPLALFAAPYAAMVVDARNGEVLHSRNADTRLHPASLTKMMTLYIAFQAVERGEISLDTMVTIPAAAAAEPPSKLGLKKGQRIRLRYLIRAAAVKSANDAATAIAFAIEGSEAAFAQRMTDTARAMGMRRTTFRNAHGLTQEGHLSTARDMTILGRHVIYDYPQYYNIFSRQSTNAGVKTVNNTNRAFLSAYRGADGIKTGYTRAAGFNLVASAERGRVRIVATMFGGSSTAARNARVAELLDMGFERAPNRARLRKPSLGSMPKRPVRTSSSDNRDAVAASRPQSQTRRSGLVNSSLRPKARNRPTPASSNTGGEEQEGLLAAVLDDITTDAPAEQTTQEPEQPGNVAGLRASLTPKARPVNLAARPRPQPVAQPTQAPAAAVHNATVVVPQVEPEPEPGQQVVTRAPVSGGRHWGINVGRYSSHYEAERALLRVALNEIDTLEGSTRRVIQGSRGYDANFMGLDRDIAELACSRLQARAMTCFMIGPS